jgi:hypothetical protein
MATYYCDVKIEFTHWGTRGLAGCEEETLRGRRVSAPHVAGYTIPFQNCARGLALDMRDLEYYDLSYRITALRGL